MGKKTNSDQQQQPQNHINESHNIFFFSIQNIIMSDKKLTSSSPDDIQVQIQIMEAKGLYKCDLFGISPYASVYVLDER